MILRAQILVDVRRQFRLWIVFVLAGLLKVVPWPMPFLEDIGVVGSAIAYWIGVPLLAAMPFALEFQFGTISSLMSQPVERKAVWNGKTLVAFVSVASLALLYWFLWNPSLNLASIGVAWSVLALGGSAILVLQTRSSSGGQVMNVLHAMVSLIAWGALWAWLSGFGKVHVLDTYTLNALRIMLIGWSVSVAIHSLAMLWLGRRKWLRFQATAGVAGTASSSTNPPELLRPILSGILRSRPSALWLNLVRKEIVLLWPVWVLTLGIIVMQLLLAVAAFFASAFFKELFGPWRDMAAGIVAVSVGFLAVLSGTLSVADERLTGTQSWHMTLPISGRRQWAIKLAAAIIPVPLCATVIGATFIVLFGIPNGVQELFNPIALFSVLVLLPIMAFWCSTAAREALQTVGWMIVLAIVLLSAAGLGILLGENPVWSFPFINGLMKFLPALPMATFVPVLLIVPAVAALLQSQFLYRTQPFGRKGPAVRRLLVLAILVGAVCCTSSMSNEFSNRRVDALRKNALLEIARAVDASRPKLTRAQPWQNIIISMAELNRSSPISAETATLVGNNPLEVFGTLTVVNGRPTTEVRIYRLALNFADGVRCDIDFPVAARSASFHCHSEGYYRRSSGNFHL